jgi:hypothetical protein
MLKRCYNPNGQEYHNYGERGIAVCDRWRHEDGFQNFILDMDWRPSDKHTLERIDNDGDYETSNCRWATQSEQMWNIRIHTRNKSGYKGVHYDKERNSWVAQLLVNAKHMQVGRYSNSEDAALAYDKAVLFFRGYGTTNFL